MRNVKPILSDYQTREVTKWKMKCYGLHLQGIYFNVGVSDAYGVNIKCHSILLYQCLSSTVLITF